VCLRSHQARTPFSGPPGGNSFRSARFKPSAVRLRASQRLAAGLSCVSRAPRRSNCQYVTFPGLAAL
jgi:hypothetical protein